MPVLPEVQSLSCPVSSAPSPLTPRSESFSVFYGSCQKGKVGLLWELPHSRAEKMGE